MRIFLLKVMCTELRINYIYDYNFHNIQICGEKTFPKKIHMLPEIARREPSLRAPAD